MTTPRNVTLIRAANTLKRRAARGHGVPVEDMLRAAEKVLTSHAEAGRDRLRAAIADVHAAIDQWRKDGDGTAVVATTNAITSDAESQGEALGLRMLVEVSTRLAAFMSLFAMCANRTPDDKVALAIAHHLDAMNIALDGGRDATIDEQSRTLLRNLELTRRTLKVQ